MKKYKKAETEWFGYSQIIQVSNKNWFRRRVTVKESFSILRLLFYKKIQDTWIDGL